jgi:hypothetical protein
MAAYVCKAISRGPTPRGFTLKNKDILTARTRVLKAPDQKDCIENENS